MPDKAYSVTSRRPAGFGPHRDSTGCPRWWFSTVSGYAFHRVHLSEGVHETGSRPPFTVTAKGQVWLALDGRDVAEYLAFTKAAAAAGLRTSPLFQDPQPWGMAEIEHVVSQHGMRLQEEMQFKFERSDPLAQGTSRPVTIDAIVKITGISTDPIPDDLFTVPAGYTKK
jgi:hypothetical protein